VYRGFDVRRELLLELADLSFEFRSFQTKTNGCNMPFEFNELRR
jgi:hypothetical protein